MCVIACARVRVCVCVYVRGCASVCSTAASVCSFQVVLKRITLNLYESRFGPVSPRLSGRKVREAPELKPGQECGGQTAMGEVRLPSIALV